MRLPVINVPPVSRMIDDLPFSRLLCDGRWRGPHGIGRFATEVLARLPGAAIIQGEKSFLTPLDPLRIDRLILQERPLAYFTPGFNPPVFSKIPLVMTIHDLIHLRIPEEGGALKGLYYEVVVKPALRKSFRILTVSRFSKEEILSWVRIPEEKIVVVGNGVSEIFSSEGPVCRPGFPYFLYVGNRKPHKNLPLLFDAFSLARLPDPFRLFLSGPPDSKTQGEIARRGLEGKIFFGGEIPEGDLSALYRGATALLFPSRLEGFGLPVLEAMSCGVPVLASRISSVEEIAGSTVEMLSPDEPDSWARAMEMQVSENSSVFDEKKRKAIDRSRQFSWESVSERVNAVLLEAMDRLP